MTTISESLDRKSTRLNSSHQIISYAVFCLKKKIRRGGRCAGRRRRCRPAWLSRGRPAGATPRRGQRPAAPDAPAAPARPYFFFFNDTATTEIYTLSLHDALPI